MKTAVLVIAILLHLSGSAFADGKFYTEPEKVPPDLPYQRALIAHDGARELLILQSKFEGEAKDFGWVVPLPSVPELASMEPADTRALFWSLDRSTGPYAIRISSYLWLVVFFASFGMLLYALFESLSRKFRRTKTSASPSPGKVAIIGGLLLLVVFFSSPSLLGGHRGVEVIKEQQVGIYDVKVVKAQDSDGLIEWLDEHNYQFSEADRGTFDSYVRQGWCFVTARIDLKKAGEESFSNNEGLVNPLVMLFESKEIVYPLALTGTIGSKTVVLLYIFDLHKVHDASGRFIIRYVGRHQMGNYRFDLNFKDFDFHKDWNFKQEYLTKLKATLTPEQMKEDLILEQAPDDKPYREHVYRW